MKKSLQLLSALVVLVLLAACGSDHPSRTISLQSPDGFDQMAKERGNYYRCGTVDLYRETSMGWKNVCSCVLWAKETMSGTDYYVAVYNDSMYESDWVMARISPSNANGKYEVFYGGETLYCWGSLPKY